MMACIQPLITGLCKFMETNKTPSSAIEFLNNAAQHQRDRAAAYDSPDGERSMAKTVEIFNAFHDLGMTEVQGWHFMQILKDVRLFQNAEEFHRDSGEDGISYASLKCEAFAKLTKGNNQ